MTVMTGSREPTCVPGGSGVVGVPLGAPTPLVHFCIGILGFHKEASDTSSPASTLARMAAAMVLALGQPAEVKVLTLPARAVQTQQQPGQDVCWPVRCDRGGISRSSASTLDSCRPRELQVSWYHSGHSLLFNLLLATKTRSHTLQISALQKHFSHFAGHCVSVRDHLPLSP